MYHIFNKSSARMLKKFTRFVCTSLGVMYSFLSRRSAARYEPKKVDFGREIGGLPPAAARLLGTQSDQTTPRLWMSESDIRRSDTSSISATADDRRQRR